MKVRWKHALVIAGGTVLGIAALTIHSRVRARVPAAQSPSEAVPAAVALVQRHRVSNSLSVAGEFIPYQEVEIHAKVAGYIRTINVDIGDRVKAGQVLAVLEIPELDAQVLGADAGVRHSSEEITRAQNEVARAQANHEALHAASLRLQEAAKARPGLIAEQELDDAESRDRASEAQVDVAKSALAAAKEQLGVSRANRSQVGALSDYSRITAPFSGVVTWRYADTGALVQAGTSNANSEPVVKLAEVDTMRLRIPVPESVAASIRRGQTADVRVQATGEHFEGKVTRFTDSLDRATRTMEVEIDVPNRADKLAPGMYADVNLELQDRPNVLTVPVQALTRNGDKATVLVVSPEHRVEVREVQTGVETPNRVEVVSGLREGEQVIVGNLGDFRAGELVEPQVTKFAAAAENGGGQ